MNKKAIKTSLRGLVLKGYTSSPCPSIALYPAAAYKLHFRDCNRTELYHNEKLGNERWMLLICQQESVLFGFKRTITAQEN